MPRVTLEERIARLPMELRLEMLRQLVALPSVVADNLPNDPYDPLAPPLDRVFDVTPRLAALWTEPLRTWTIASDITSDFL